MIGRFALVCYHGFGGESAGPCRPQDQMNLLRLQVPEQFSTRGDIGGAIFQYGDIPSNRDGCRLAAFLPGAIRKIEHQACIPWAPYLR